MKIAVAQGALTSLDVLTTEFAQQAQIFSGPVDSPEQVAELTRDADGLIVSLQKLSARHLAALGSSVRAIGRAGVGLDTIDLDAAADRAVAVIYQPDYATNEVADHALAMLLTAHRRTAQADARLRAEGWLGGAELGPVSALQECTAGVIGAGRIGRAVAQRLRPFVARVVAWDANPLPANDATVWVDSLHDLLIESDIITVHLPLTPQTRHIISTAELKLLRPGASVVNVSRGGLVDEDALVEALQSGYLNAAALDVFGTEPLPADSPLRSAPNLVLSPHVAWYSSTSGGRLARWTVEDMISFLSSDTVTHGRHAIPAPVRA